MQEIWKDVKGYEGYYQVSNYGRVKSIERYIKNTHGITSHKKEIIKKQTLKKSGYYYVYLYKNNSGKSFTVHRLVAKAFIVNKYNKKTVNHKDSNKLNNNVENLEWNTYRENNLHCLKYGKRKYLINENKIIRLYKKGYTMKQTSILMKCCVSTVFKVLKKYNIPSRKQGVKMKYYYDFNK